MKFKRFVRPFFVLPIGLVAASASAFAEIVPLAPVDGAEVNLVLPAPREVAALPTHDARVARFKADAAGEKRLLKAEEWRRADDLVLSWRVTDGETGPWKVLIGKADRFERESDTYYIRSQPVNAATGREEQGEATGAVVTCTIPRANLEVGETYRWQVVMRGNCGKFGCGPHHPCGLYTNVIRSSVATFRTSSAAPRWIALEGRVGNVRDLGGWRTLDGRRVRQGLAYRGQGLNDNSVSGEAPGENRLTVEDRRYLVERLGIRTDLDLRGPDELAGLSASPIGPSVRLVHNPSESYRDIFTEKGRAAMARNFRLFSDQTNYPIYFHCIGGADRTGALAYVLNAILGVSQHDLEVDWESTFYPTPPDVWPEYTGPDYWCNLCHLDNGFAQYGGPKTPIRAKVEKYLAHCGITSGEIAAFRRIMLTEETN